MYEKIEKQFWCLIFGVPLLELALWLADKNYTYTDDWSWIRFVITCLILGNIAAFIWGLIHPYLKKKGILP